MFGKTVLDIPSLASACGFHYGSNNDFYILQEGGRGEISMYSYRGIVNDLLKEFPQISENYEEEIDRIKDTFQGEETEGQTIYFDSCFCDYIGRLLMDEHRDNIRIEKVFAFLENMAVSEDQEVRNLLQVTVLEYLRSWYLLQSESEKLMLPETKKIFECVKSYLREPPQDAVPWFSI